MENTHIPLSISQKEIWLEDKIFPALNIHFIGGYIKICGELDPDVFGRALITVIKDHDAFRLRIDENSEDPYQQLLPAVDYEPIFLDFTKDQKVDEGVWTWMKKSFSAPMPITSFPLFSFALLKEQNNVFYWFIKIHHIIIDGWGISQLGQTVAQHYTRLRVTDQKETFPVFSYVDAAKRDMEYLQSQDYLTDKQFWQRTFKTFSPPLIPRVKKKTAPSKREVLYLERNLYNQIISFVKKYETTVFQFLAGCLYLYLSRVFGLQDLTLGYPILNRDNEQDRGTIGLFTRLLPLRIQVKHHVSFIELLREIKQHLSDNSRHKRFSVSKILKNIKGFALNQHRLFDIVLSFARHNYQLNFANSKGSAKSFGNEALQHPLSIMVEEFNRQDDVRFVFDYNEAYFTLDDMKRFIVQFEYLLLECLNTPHQLLKEFELVTPQEREKIISEFNHTRSDYPEKLRIEELFSQQVQKYPNKTAVIYNKVNLTYQRLDRLAAQLTQRIDSYPLQPDIPLGIILERTDKIVIAVLAILKAGSTFVPIDPDYPEERINYMLKDSKCQLIITETLFEQQLTDITDTPLLNIDRVDFNKSTETILPTLRNAIAYVIYTSGSTGTPKGVKIRHNGIINMFGAQKEVFRVSSADNILQFASISFDASIFELCMSLLSGAALVIAPGEVIQDPTLFTAFLDTHEITIATLPPSYLNLLPKKKIRHLRVLITAGDSPYLEDMAYYSQQLEYYNAYGPTEVSIWSTVHRIPPNNINDQTRYIIGRPINNLSILILDQYGKMLPINRFGEICIAGVGLAEGYLNSDRINQHKFVEHPYQAGELIYKSGDRGRWLADGTLQFAGRNDEQLKVRGFRIEPVEIEKQLLDHEEIKQAVVDAHALKTEEKEIIAYLVPTLEEPSLSADTLRRFLAKKLPHFMIPTHFVFLPKLPLTPSGKVDKKALLSQTNIVTGKQKSTDQPRNQLERKLQQICKQVFSYTAIGIHDNFFDAGANSMHAVKIAAKLCQEFTRTFTVQDVLTNASIAQLVNIIEDRDISPNMNIKPVPALAHYDISPTQKQMWLANEFSSNKSLYNIQICYRIRGVLNVKRLTSVLQRITMKHDSLRTIFLNIGGEIKQKVLPMDHFFLEIDEYCFSTKDETDREVSKVISTVGNKVFDLGKAPLFRSALLKFTETDYILVLVFHHIICDWLSIEIIQKEIQQLYTHMEGPKKSFTDVQYKDYVYWLKQRMDDERCSLHEQFWMRTFQDAPQTLRLPYDNPRPQIQSFSGSLIQESLSRQLMNKLTKKSREWDTTIYTILLASINVLMFKYTKQTDIVLGGIFSGRESAALDNIIGCFLNTVALRTRFQGDQDFKEIVRKVNTVMLTAQEHQHYPLTQIIEQLRLSERLGELPLFNVVVDMIYMHTKQQFRLDESVCMQPIVYDYKKSKFDLTIYILTNENDMTVFFEYSTEMFVAATIKNMLKRWIILLEKLLGNSNIPIKEISLANLIQLPQIRRISRT